MDDGAARLILPPPPADLKAPNVEELGAETVLHRVHDRRLAGNAFNPCQGSLTRFAPIRNRNGNCVPSLYASGTIEAALYETIFHDVPVAAVRKTVPATQVAARKHSALRLRRTLKLASLRAPELRKWGVVRDALLGSLPVTYQQTALWAKGIHDQFPSVDGLIWTSIQCDPDDALLLFGDRVASTDIEVVSVRDGSRDGSLWNDAREAAHRAGIRISL